MMLKKIFSILCIWFVCLCFNDTQAAMYYYLPSFAVVQSEEEEFFATLGAPVDMDGAGVSIVGGNYDGRFLSVCLQLEEPPQRKTGP